MLQNIVHVWLVIYIYLSFTRKLNKNWWKQNILSRSDYIKCRLYNIWCDLINYIVQWDYILEFTTELIQIQPINLYIIGLFLACICLHTTWRTWTNKAIVSFVHTPLRGINWHKNAKNPLTFLSVWAERYITSSTFCRNEEAFYTCWYSML